MTALNHLQLYSQLINMGFDEDISLMAAENCQNINEAIEWIESNNETEKNKTNENDNEYKSVNIDCDGDVLNCFALKRIISMLQFYDSKYMNDNALNEYLINYRMRLISDYHHILNNHLNEDNMLSIQSNQQFTQIHNMIKNSNLQCNIEKCVIYRRNNRARETTNIECTDNKLSVFIDIMDSIHCYFMHSVDIGYRIFNKINNDTEDENKNNQRDDLNVSHAYDPQMNRLYDYMQCRRELLQSMRGQKRIFNNKFMTQISDVKFQSKKTDQTKSAHCEANEDLDDIKKSDDKQNQVLLEGYLQKQSLYLKQLRKRFIILMNNHLYCYKNHKKLEMTECIDLSSYKQATISQREICQFELVPKNQWKNKLRIFEADSMDDAGEWIREINDSINPPITSTKSNQAKHDNVFSFGERRDYWTNTAKEHSKYKSIKEEVTSNKIYSISIDHFNNAYQKATQLCIYSPNIKQLKSYGLFPDDFNLENGQPPSTEHILSIVLYTDYDTLSYRLSRTFRKIQSNESDTYIKTRNNQFWNWSKTLIENVNAFGTQLQNSKIQVFYHGVSFMYFHSFVATLNSPTSTTTKLQIAYQFATNDGIIVEMGKMLNDWTTEWVRYFNCTFISCFANEDERLFIQPIHGFECLNIVSIRNMATNENYREYIQAMCTFQGLIKYNSNPVIISSDCMDIMNEIISRLTENSIATFPDYITNILQEWSNVVDKKVVISMNFIRNNADKIKIYRAATYEEKQDMIRFDTLNMIFKNVEKILIHDVTVDDKLSFWKEISSMLDRINEFSFSKLREITLATGDYITVVEEKKYRSLFTAKKWILSKPDPFTCLVLTRSKRHIVWKR